MSLDFPEEMMCSNEQQELAEEEGEGEGVKRVIQAGTAYMKAQRWERTCWITTAGVWGWGVDWGEAWILW